MLTRWRIPAGLFVIAHGIAHLMATSVYWRLTESPDLPYTTLILGGQLDLGETGVQLFGAVWLLAGLFTAAGGAALMARLPRARLILLAAALFSLAICLLVYDRAQVGIVINLAILLAVAVAQRWPARSQQIAGAH